MLSTKSIFVKNLLEAKRQYDPSIDPNLISTRLPAGEVNPHTLTGSKKLTVGREFMTDPEQNRRIADKLTTISTAGQLQRAKETGKPAPRMMPNVGVEMIRKHRSPLGLIDALGSQIERNLERGLERAMSLPELAERSQQWYVGASKISKNLADRFGIPHHKMAAVIATQSPQKDWYMNASLAERIAKIHKEHQQTGWSPEMDRAASVARPGKNKAPVFDKENQQHMEMLTAIKGKSLGQLTDPTHKAAWIRTYDEAHHPRRFRTISPEGEFGPFVSKKSGKTSDIAWGGFDSIAKAVRVLEGGDKPEDLSPHLGEEHKVRSFYNNILQPNAPRDVSDVTVDTHAIGSALGRYNITSATPDLQQFMGGAGSVQTGQSGLYPVIADVTKKVASKFGMIPNAVQSVTWDEKRSADVSAAQGKKIQAQWEKFRRGQQSDSDTMAKVNMILGPVKPASWMKVKTTPTYTSTMESKNTNGNLLTEMNSPNKFGHVTTTGILTPEAKKMMEKQGFQFVASEKTEAGVMLNHFMTPKVISMAKQEILQGGFADSCGTMGRMTDLENPTNSTDVVGKIKNVLQQMATKESQKERFKKTFSLRPNMFSGTARDFMQFGIDPQTPGAVSGRFKEIEED
jgi:hypothetical protein